MTSRILPIASQTRPVPPPSARLSRIVGDREASQKRLQTFAQAAQQCLGMCPSTSVSDSAGTYMPVNNTLLNDEDSMGHEHVNASDGVRYHSDLLLLPCAPIGLTLWALAQGQLSLAMLSGGLLCLLLAIVLERGSSPKPLSEVLPTVFLASCVHGAAIVALLILAGLWPPGTAPRLVWGAVAAGLSLALIALAQGRSGDKKMERWLVTLSLGSALLSGGLGMLP